jgi:hypothetical protein
MTLIVWSIAVGTYFMLAVGMGRLLHLASADGN